MAETWNEPWPDTTMHWPRRPRRRERRQLFPARDQRADGGPADEDLTTEDDV